MKKKLPGLWVLFQAGIVSSWVGILAISSGEEGYRYRGTIIYPWEGWLVLVVALYVTALSAYGLWRSKGKSSSLPEWYEEDKPCSKAELDAMYRKEHGTLPPPYEEGAAPAGLPAERIWKQATPKTRLFLVEIACIGFFSCLWCLMYLYMALNGATPVFIGACFYFLVGVFTGWVALEMFLLRRICPIKNYEEVRQLRLFLKKSNRVAAAEDQTQAAWHNLSEREKEYLRENIGYYGLLEHKNARFAMHCFAIVFGIMFFNVSGVDLTFVAVVLGCVGMFKMIVSIVEVV